MRPACGEELKTPKAAITNGEMMYAVVIGRRGVGWRAIAVTPDEVIAGFALMACADCIGSGVFLEPDDTPVRCWTCKGSGCVGVAL